MNVRRAEAADLDAITALALELWPSHEWEELYQEMAERKTLESKIYKALDGLEAVIQHNISDLSTWIPKEYELNKHYADDKVAFSEYLKEVREEIRKDTLKKLGE